MNTLQRLKQKALELQSAGSSSSSTTTATTIGNDKQDNTSKANVKEKETEKEKPKENEKDEEKEKGDDWLDARSPKKKEREPLRFINNSRPKKSLTLDRLVWVKYYSWGTLVPARLCDNQEALTESSIEEWPIPADKAVVEVFGQVDEKDKNHRQLLLVNSIDMFPFWAKSLNCKPDDFDSISSWNASRVDYLKKMLCNKMTKFSTTERHSIFERMMSTANDFLEAAHNSERELQLKHSTDKDEQLKFNVQETPLTTEEVEVIRLKPCMEELEVGDEICYYDKVMPDSLRYAKIEAINTEGNVEQPLQLSSGDVLYSTDCVGKIPKDQSSTNRDKRRPNVRFHPIQHFLNFRLNTKSTKKRKLSRR